MYRCEVLLLRTAMLYRNRFSYDSLSENKKILQAWSSLLRCVYTNLPRSAIDKLACGVEIKDRVKPTSRMFLSMSCAADPKDFLKDMRSDVESIVDREKVPERWPKGGYKELRGEIKKLLGYEQGVVTKKGS